MEDCEFGKPTAAALAEVLCSEDLLPKILIRLPPRDLLRLKSVSRQWKRIISDPRFAAVHTQSTPLPPPAGVILYHHIRCAEPFEAVAVPVFGNPPNSVPSLSFMNKAFANPDYKFTHIQSCNGLLLCVISKHKKPMLNLLSQCYVCNPTTMDLKLLPLPLYLKPNEWLDGLTLAFNPLEPLRYRVIGIKKQKVVELTGFEQEESRGEIHIYSSETNSWKFSSFVEGLEFRTRLVGAFLKDTVYWTGVHQMHYYNVHSEEAGSMCLPTSSREYSYKGWKESFLVTSCGRLYSTLFQFRGLGSLEYHIFEFDSSAMKWSSPQVEVFGTTSKLLTHSASPKLVARGDNKRDFVLLLTHDDWLFIFDLVSRKYVGEIKLHSDYCCRVCHYIPSLAPV